MSQDNTREKQLAGAAAFATRLARKHVAEIERMFSVIAAIAADLPALPASPGELTTILWASYLGHLVGHLNSLIGQEATAAILKQVAHVQSGADRAH